MATAHHVGGEALNNFDMRIPVRELKVLRWQDGRVVLELRSAFGSVDPIVIEVSEAAMSSFREEIAAFQRPAPERASLAPAARSLPAQPPSGQASHDGDGEAGADRAHRAPLGDSRFTWGEAGATVPGTPPDDNDLTEEELNWLARSAG